MSFYAHLLHEAEGLPTVESMISKLMILGTIGGMFFVLAYGLKIIPSSGDRRKLTLAHQERVYFRREMLVDIAFWAINPIVLIPLNALSLWLVVDHLLRPYIGHQIFDAYITGLPFFWQVVLATVVGDIALYARHRFVHTFAWPYHTVHHTAEEIGWTTKDRMHPGDKWIMGTIDLAVLYVLGFSGEAMMFAGVIMSLVNYFNHSNVYLDYGFPLRYVFVSPNMHRWHHAADDRSATMQNFCIVWAWIDLLFGTFYVPKGRLPGAYGVWDDDGKPVAAGTFWAQLIYPFVCHYRTIKGWMGR